MSSMALSERGGHELMHRLRLVAFDEVGRPAAAAEELLQFLMLDRARTVGLLIL